VPDAMGHAMAARIQDLELNDDIDGQTIDAEESEADLAEAIRLSFAPWQDSDSAPGRVLAGSLQDPRSGMNLDQTASARHRGELHRAMSVAVQDECDDDGL